MARASLEYEKYSVEESVTRPDCKSRISPVSRFCKPSFAERLFLSKNRRFPISLVSFRFLFFLFFLSFRSAVSLSNRSRTSATQLRFNIHDDDVHARRSSCYRDKSATCNEYRDTPPLIDPRIIRRARLPPLLTPILQDISVCIYTLSRV